MSVNKIPSSYINANYNSALKNPEKIAKKEEKSEEKTEEKAVKTKTSAPDTDAMQAIYEAQRSYVKGMQNMVNQLLEQAGSKIRATFADGEIDPGIDMQFAVKYSKLLVRNEDGSYGLDPSLTADEQAALIAKAKEDVSEDGYFGVKNTSDRILSFAKAITGGDPTKIDEMQRMVEKAFNQVREMFGGELPDICNRTFDAILKGFEEWRGGVTEESAETVEATEA